MQTTEHKNEEKNEAQPSEVERLQEQLRNEHDMYLRALADFDNYRRRVERDSAAAVQSGKRGIILSLLDVVDNFDWAFQHMNDVPGSVLEGMRAIHRKLLGLLEAQGIKPFDSLGQTFNPELHEAIASVPSDSHQPGEIVDEVQRGYRWGDQVLRPARVRVAT